MKEEQLTIFDTPRWTILVTTEDANSFEEVEFKVTGRQENLFSNEYVILEIESVVAGDPGYTAEDVLVSTGALAVHEEWTNAVVTIPDSIDDIADEMYCWKGAGGVFLADMLTALERLDMLMQFFYEKYKDTIHIDDMEIRLGKKENPKIPLTDNVEKLFSDDIYSVIWKDKEETIWWANIIENRGMFLAIIDEDLEEEEEVKKLPAPRYPYNENLRDYYDELWGGYYDDYDYDDRYYSRT